MGVGKNRNAPCPCGSGKKRKHCHGTDVSEEDFVSIDLRDLASQERWLLLAAEIKDILRLPDPFGGADLKAAFKRRHVRPINDAYQMLIGQFSTELTAPPLSNTSLGALYLGDIQEKRLRSNVMRMSLYADVIYVVDPFVSPRVVFGDSGSPATNPDNFILSTYQAAYFLLRMRHWIASGIVHLLPNPMFTFNSYRDYVLRAAREHADKFLDPDLAKAEFQEAFFELSINAEMFAGIPDLRIEDALESMFPGMPEKIVVFAAQTIRAQRDSRLDIPRDDIFSDKISQMNIRRGGMDPISAAMICSQVTAFPFAEQKTKLTLVNTLFENKNNIAEEWAPIAQAFRQIEMEFLNEVSSDFAIGLRSDGRLQGFRSLLRKLWKDMDAGPTAPQNAVLQFSDELRGEYENAKQEWEAIRLDAAKFGIGAAGVFAAGAFMLNLPTLLSASGTLVGAYAHWRKTKSFRARNPASVLIDLRKRENRE